MQIHQRVPAGQQIDARDRRIIDQVVPAEDDLPAEILADAVQAGKMLEVPGQQLRRNSLQLPFLVRGLAGGIERIFIHVGCVNLDSLAELVGPERLSQEHRYGIGLRAAGATTRSRPPLGLLLPESQPTSFTEAGSALARAVSRVTAAGPRSG
jgi:hypothetical protein